jgi:hypothetical protein
VGDIALNGVLVLAKEGERDSGFIKVDEFEIFKGLPGL